MLKVDFADQHHLPCQVPDSLGGKLDPTDESHDTNGMYFLIQF